MNLLTLSQSSLMAASIVAFGTTTATAQQHGQQSAPADLVNALHSAFGDHHSRAVHAKGIILEGSFTPDEGASRLTKASHLQSKGSKVIVRFSDFTGIPDIPDNVGDANPRGMAIKFILPDGSTTDLVTHSFNGFPTPNSDEFRELLLSIGASGPGAAKPTQLSQFLDTHPVAKTFLTTQHTPASYAAISYYGINSFKFTNRKGAAQYVRYQILPAEGESLLTPQQLAQKGPDYLINEIKDHVAAGSIRFLLYVQIAAEGDIIDNPSIAWPDTRKKVLLGTIELKSLAPDTVEDKKLFFIPNNIPDGIEPADPMIDFRSAAYPISVKERQ